jgi:hypothetical protein
MDVHSEDHPKPMKELCGKNAELLDKRGSNEYNFHCVPRG